jgi:hypothetical protein
VRQVPKHRPDASALLKDKVFVFELAKFVRSLPELIPGMMDRFEYGGVAEESVSTTAPVTTADTADARSGLPGVSAESCC